MGSHFLLPLLMLADQVFARTIAVPPVPAPEFADTEVSTNIAIRVSDLHTREMGMRFALHGAGISNCLQVALGHDEDGDGVLGVNETETLFGWRNGRYFAENVPSGFRVEEEASDEGTSRVFTNLSASAQGWLYSPKWNMMRVTRGGSGVLGEWFSCDIRSYFFVIELM